MKFKGFCEECEEQFYDIDYDGDLNSYVCPRCGACNDEIDLEAMLKENDNECGGCGNYSSFETNNTPEYNLGFHVGYAAGYADGHEDALKT